jgi:dephospho-CoA kinase
MKIIGLTGGSGAGKSEVCKAFLSFGVESIDTDKISREVAKKDSECLKELAENFSDVILTKSGELDRKKLAEIAFASKEKHGLLNKITHKYILNECKGIILDIEKNGDKAVIIDAPMLFESGFDKECDVIISVIADLDKRIERLIKRDNITEEQINLRIKNQKNDEFFIENSNNVIYNNSDYDNIYTQVSKIYNDIFEKNYIIGENDK